MLSKLALRAAATKAANQPLPWLPQVVTSSLLCEKLTEVLQRHNVRELSVSSPYFGKNIYYGYAQKEKEKPHGRGHKYAMYALCGFLVLYMLKSNDFIRWLGLEAREIDSKSGDSVAEEGEEAGEEQVKKKKKKTTFREKTIIEYENRLRSYSTPDKIFRYFATLKVKKEGSDSFDVYMTPDDFVRSLMPGVMQPEEYGLDKFKKFDPEVDSLSSGTQVKLREGSIFYQLESHGLISFSDYIFLLTLLSTPSKQFELAFKMFDDNGDGNLDKEEYERVQAIIRARTTVGQRHRDHSTTGSVLKSDPSGALTKYFFGDGSNEKLPYQKFIQFHKDIHDEILWIEYHVVAEENEVMSERDFANQILLYAGYSDQKRISVCRRVRKMFKDDAQHGISFQEYYDFAQVLKNINEIDTALTFYHVAGASIDKATFKHVAKTVAKVKLTDHLVDVVFAIFDDNGDERLSNKEFVAVMKRRLMRGLERPRETGFAKLFTAITACSKSMIAEQLSAIKETIVE